MTGDGTGTGGESIGPAEELYAEFVRAAAEDGSDGSGSFEAFCARHPDLAAELRVLHETRRRIEAALARGLGALETDRPTPRPGDGAGAAAGRSGALSASGLVSAEVLQKLASHRPDHSRYKLEGEIARGGMGAILKVWDEDLGRHLAMKVILGREEDELDPADTTADAPHVEERRLGRFLEEAQVTGQLDHPGIVPVHELGVDDRGRVYFTMRLVRGRNLKQIFQLVRSGEEDWTRERALGVILRVCETLAFAHSRGVIHRDLKPANVMVGRFGEMHVIDWGLARVLGREDTKDIRIRPADQTTVSLVRTSIRSASASGTGSATDSPILTMDGDVIGTPAYMAPEQAGGFVDEVGPHSDVYSMGCMLYHLLTESMPYVPRGKRLGARAVLQRVLDGPPTPVHELAPDVPGELQAICERAMAREPERRYESMEALADDLRRYLEGRVVTAYQTGALAELRKWIARNRGTFAALASTAAAVVLGLGLVAFVQSKARREQQRLNDDLTRVNARLTGHRVDQLVAEQEQRPLAAIPTGIEAIDAWFPVADDVLAQESAFTAALEAGDIDSTEIRGTLEKLGVLADLRREVEARRERALEIERVSAVDARDLWHAAIADVAESELYGGLELRPQSGLVPLGRTAQGFWEFWHLASGSRPEFDPELGARITDDAMGIALVLLPGGTFTMGSPMPADPTPSPIYVDGVWSERQHDVTLQPFLLGKFEVTQAQWIRTMGENPSYYYPGRESEERGPLTLRNPVESVTWFECVEFARRLGLALPTEARWEYAVRAGADQDWPWGDDRRSIAGMDNILDKRSGAGRVVSSDGLLEDPYYFHAPVGSMRPNAFGLYDVPGNVKEWCQDVYVVAYPPSTELDASGGYPDRTGRNRVVRGASWYDFVDFTRCAVRLPYEPRTLDRTRGMRAARSLDP